MLLSAILPKNGVYSEADPKEVLIESICDRIQDIKGRALFICKEGARFSPIEHLDEIEGAGAAAILLSKGCHPKSPPTVPCFYAEDLTEAEGQVLKRFYADVLKELKLFAVTGTNGKTSTALFLAHLFHSSGIPTAYIGTLGTLFGDEDLSDGTAMTTPSAAALYRQLSRLAERGARQVVMEVSSHAIAQERVSTLPFCSAIFTNLSEDHLDYHKTMEKYYRTKKRLFSQAELAIVCVDDDYGARLCSELTIPVRRVAVLADEADYTVADWYENGTEDTQYLCVAPFGSFGVTYPLFSSFNVYNTLLAIAAASEAGLCPDQISRALRTLPHPRGRLEKLSLDEPFSVIIDYAHTPDAVKGAIKAVRRSSHGRLFVLLGAGGEREREKRPKMAEIAVSLSDTVILTSDNPRGEDPTHIFSDLLSGVGRRKNYILIPDRADAIRYALSFLRDRDTLLLLGKGHEEYLIEGEKRIAFSEKQTVYDYFKEKKA